MSLPEKSSYPYILDHKPSFFLSWFLYRLFRRVGIDENMKDDLRQMHREGTVVYAIKYRGRLDYLLYHYNFRRRRLPYPKIAPHKAHLLTTLLVFSSWPSSEPLQVRIL
jgi:glycerol-3-phosphate O-acyltransferase